MVHAVRAGYVLDDRPIIDLTTLIDHLWDRWVEGGDDGFGRSHLLMRLATLEADTLSAGVPRTQLDHAEQQSLRTLITSDLIRVRDERVRFSHDLLGDWARMRVLVGEDLITSPAHRQRTASPRWHRAVRLFGQRLLEQSPGNCEQWRLSVASLDDGSDTGQLLRDILLESVFLAPNARQLFERVWSVLTADGGRLLTRLLDRFLYVATLPDPRLANFAESAEAAAQLEYAFRIPFGPYWGPLLITLHAHRDEIVRLAPFMAARVCSLWLRTTPTTLESGRPMPWRREAAELAVAVAREVQALKVEGEYFSDNADRIAYEAALYAAPDLPDAVTALCLELAERRDPAPEISVRADRADQAGEEANRQWEEANPERVRELQELRTPVFPRGPLREPWPDGPRASVDEAFRAVCLNTAAFPSMIRTRPDAALEILLAVCIEGPQHEDPYAYSLHEDCGIIHWHEGYPPLYFRGPFLAFFRESPHQALSFVLRLVNFATRRCVTTEPHRLERMGISAAEADLGLTIIVDGKPRRWSGDAHTFRWHHDWPHDAMAIPCVLMALEKWLYEELDQDKDIAPWLTRILAESESIAFAGLLLDIGKRDPRLFIGVLRPLLRSWQLYDLDLHVTVERSGGSVGLMAWSSQPQKLTALAREWYGFSDRKQLFRDIAIRIMLFQEDMHPFFADVRTDWGKQLNGQRGHEAIQLLIERLNPQNYTRHPQPDGLIRFDFAWSEEIQKRNDADQRQADEQTRFMMFPWQCRKRLDDSTPVAQDDLIQFWENLHAIHDGPSAPSTEPDPAPIHIEDAVCGGIAVLLIFHLDWLKASPDRFMWCRQALEKIIEKPPAWSIFDTSNAIGNTHWDAFAGECGVALLAENRDDQLARILVGLGVIAFRYGTTALTMWRAFGCRERLGDDFDRMLSLAFCWAGVRTLYERANQLQFESERSAQRHHDLLWEFVDRRLPAERASLQQINATTAVELQALHARRFADKAVTMPRSQKKKRGSEPGSLRPTPPEIDLQVLASACGWLNLDSARSPDERRKWLALIRELLDASLKSIPAFDPSNPQKTDGLPSSFDNWVFTLVARTVLRMTPSEDPESLWRPIIDLGTPAHHWVEHFFWQWFTDGVQASRTPESFVVGAELPGCAGVASMRAKADGVLA